ncbi:MAG TPA: hypothetical protein VLG74_15410 [Blastocatellia bacterium]|nr:hypothetical protein [Blastocatellia bacterium]
MSIITIHPGVVAIAGWLSIIAGLREDFLNLVELLFIADKSRPSKFLRVYRFDARYGYSVRSRDDVQPRIRRDASFMETKALESISMAVVKL